MRAVAMTFVSRALRVEVTSSLALTTWLMEDRDRFEARRWETRDSSGAASRSGEDCREGILSLEDDMLKQWMFYMFVDDQADGEGVGRRHIVLSVGSIRADWPDIICGHRLLPDSSNTSSVYRQLFTDITAMKLRRHHWRPLYAKSE